MIHTDYKIQTIGMLVGIMYVDYILLKLVKWWWDMYSFQ